MIETLLIISLLLLVVVIVLQVALKDRNTSSDLSRLEQRFAAADRAQERAERNLTDQLGKNRTELLAATGEGRRELTTSVKAFGDTLHDRLTRLTAANDEKLDKIRETVETKLTSLQADNTKALEKVRETVDEKLQGTLEKRLSQSFKLISERLEKVHQGLGEMQSLASGVGDLKRVLTNVKTRGTWGEVQLEALLQQVLAPEQYSTNVATRGTSERVEFTINLPGQSPQDGSIVWLPIDSKFPIEDYQRLVDAHEKADTDAAAAASRAIETSIKNSAKSIAEKYVSPPQTTDFAILYLPIEGLFAEVVQKPDLFEILQRNHRITVAGPTTLAALLNSLQMGFRTLAIQQRSSEVWAVLSEVKTQFGMFHDVLQKVQKKLSEASSSIDKASTRTRVIEKKLRNVEELPAPAAHEVLQLIDADENETDRTAEA